jgi:D-beta-D-heptose 7-phosphate kinase/D-beta-D-heptose 1-phosphate adenosyltransferase
MRNSRAGAFFNLKIKTLHQLTRIARALRKRGRRIVFTNGCFDIIHYGHVQYLAAAKQKGDVLIVGVNSDASVRRLKGKPRPFVSQHDRLGIIAALGCVDYVVMFSQGTPRTLIASLKPHVLVKGADWNVLDIVGAGFVTSYGGRVATIKLAPGRSSTGLINKIARSIV